MKTKNISTPVVPLFMGLVMLAAAAADAAAEKDFILTDLEAQRQACASLKEQGVKFSPDFFPILPWEPQHGFWQPFIQQRKFGLDSIAQCNFNMAGFVRPEDLPLCEKLHLAAIVIDETGLVDTKVLRDYTDVQIDEMVRRMVGQSGSSPAVIGYFIVDEPGVSAFPVLAKAVAAVKKYAPGKLAYINLFPSYATLGAKDISQLETTSFTDYLERFVNEVKPQLVSYDNYMVLYSNDLKDKGQAAIYYRDLLEVRRVAKKYNLPFWNIVSSNQIRPDTPIPSPANFRFQAYTTLAAGARGVTWYKYYSDGYGYSPIDKGDQRMTLSWFYLHEVNRELAVLGPLMNRLTSTGVYFTAPAPVESAAVLPGDLVKKADAATPLMIGEFRHDDGSDYVMAVNLSLESSTKVNLRMPGDPNEVRLVSTVDGELYPIDEKSGLWLVAGQGALLKLPPP